MFCNRALALAWIGFVPVCLLLLARPACADPLAGFAGFLIGGLIASEVTVIAFEAWFMWRTLRLPIGTAFRWSLLANLLSAILGPIAALFLISIPFRLGLEYNDRFSMIALPCASVPVAIALEYPVLLLLNRRGATSQPLFRNCAYMNLISVPAGYLILLVIAHVI